MVWLFVFAIIYGAALFFNAHEALDTYFRTHEHYDLDEIFTALNIAGALGLIYSVLRIKDMSREIQRRLTAEKNVDWIACHDSLTELPNRRYLASTLLKPQIIPCKDGTAIFSIDLDGFKKVNDLLGHDQGDRVLKVVAERLTTTFPDDNVYRLGGDEFVVVIGPVGPKLRFGPTRRTLWEHGVED
ncbi:GGDEF domain-containing protein [Agrobacterium tumefaciens]|nr:GGDEF domain-containing protein [Agrobacterium tumefaciens]NSZ40095.1 GGDEF domain-containing protein [Agrobacterium tumefaciens]NTB25469.1 GGDEF domain-containing protein [Agrobacterium tumefaciens]NTB30955.1 GGDEF domain-containing protein [Agrobacterium tumefaciens]NTB34275.1 GGDEF domain-containing protein [Agrobacterium tumefaciens]